MKLAAGVLLSLATLTLPTATATPASSSLAERVAERPANEGRVGEMHFKLVDKSGRTRNRVATLVHSDRGDVVKIAIHFTSPAAISETAFLSHDYIDQMDETWLYLPATERVRRLPSSDRGDTFMGTDLTYGDVKDNFKFQLTDWTFSEGQSVIKNGRALMKLAGEATPAARAEMGYSTFEALIDPDTLFPVEIIYSDVDGDDLKRIEVLEQAIVGGAWTATHFRAENLQTGHSTDIQLKEMRYEPDLDEDLLDADMLEEGAPDL